MRLSLPSSHFSISIDCQMATKLSRSCIYWFAIETSNLNSQHHHHLVLSLKCSLFIRPPDCPGHRFLNSKVQISHIYPRFRYHISIQGSDITYLSKVIPYHNRLSHRPPDFPGNASLGSQLKYHTSIRNVILTYLSFFNRIRLPH